jgi:hypothetical protein
MSSITISDARRQPFVLPWLFSPFGDIGFAVGGMLAGFAQGRLK